MKQQPISNETLIALLNDCTFRFGGLPESYNGVAIIRLIQSRLKTASCPAEENQPEVVPSKVWSDMEGTDEKQLAGALRSMRLVAPFSPYTFTDDYLENSITVYLEGCFVMDLSKFNAALIRRADEKRSNILAAIGAGFRLLSRSGRWPKGIRGPEAVLYSIDKQLTADNIHSVVESFGTKLIVGNPSNIPRYNKTIDKEAIEALEAQLNEIGRTYSGWVIQSSPTTESL